MTPARGLLAALLLSAGSLRLAHADSPSVPCQAVPEAGRDHVYIYLLNGIDPLGWGDMAGVGDTIRGWGYRHIRVGPYYRARRFRADIARVHAADADARFVVIGHSAGAVTGQWLSWRVVRDGIPVSLLVYLDGKWVRRRWPEGRLGPPPPTVNVIAPCYLRCAAVLPWAQNLRLTEGWHYGTPTHPRTLEALARELAVLSGRIRGGCAPSPVRSTRSGSHEKSLRPHG